MSVALFQKNNVITESVYGNRFLFQGREYDYDTALYYFRARWYEPETGRWLSPDPIGISGGLNLYAFCGNDPVNQIDPMGLWGIEVDGFLIGSGNPWLAFDASTIGEIGRGTAATIDGFTPWFDPFCDYLGVYSKSDTQYEDSRIAGKIARTAIVAAIPFPDPYKTYIALTEGIINAITLDDGFFEEQKGQ